jgi:hypothetical protein
MTFPPILRDFPKLMPPFTNAEATEKLEVS